MSILFTADLHLTDKPEDEHRFGLFPWLIKQAKKYKAHMIVLGGDITNSKDRHPSKLVNRFVNETAAVGQAAPVVILRGNHDYIDEAEPFFGFVNEIQNLTFLIGPMELDQCMFLPNTRNYEEAWKGINFDKPDLIFCHQTFDGAKSETGFRLEGIPPSFFARILGHVYSGDVHAPQDVSKKITYVGAPYRVRFGDDFEPRVLLIDDRGATKDLHFRTKQKHVVDLQGVNIEKEFDLSCDQQGIDPHDQVKVRVHLKRSQFHEWKAIRANVARLAAGADIELFGPEMIAAPDLAPKKANAGVESGAGAAIQPMEALVAYAKSKKLSPALLKAGQALLKGD
jgi:DNA repair exonuclease SbcCD nuclease subunit